MIRFKARMKPVAIKDARFLHSPGEIIRRRSESANGIATIKKQTMANVRARKMSVLTRGTNISASTGQTMIKSARQRAVVARRSGCTSGGGD
jgi:hypothetical protein